MGNPWGENEGKRYGGVQRIVHPTENGGSWGGHYSLPQGGVSHREVELSPGVENGPAPIDRSR